MDKRCIIGSGDCPCLEVAAGINTKKCLFVPKIKCPSYKKKKRKVTDA